MNVLSPRIHGILDYVLVVFLALAPTLFGVSGGLATLAYVLAILHLTMTVLTDFPLGMMEVVPFGVHGIIELVAAILFVVLPWILRDLFFGGHWLYTVTGVVVFLLWLASDYSARPGSAKTSPSAPSSTTRESTPGSSNA